MKLRRLLARLTPDRPPPGLPWPGRDRLDLSPYRVTDRDAGLFDVAARARLVRAGTDPVLRQAAAKVLEGASREAASALPTLTHIGFVPSFYGDPEGWRAAVGSFWAIEEAVSGLAAAFVASGEAAWADCLLDLLERWAREGAFTGYHYTHDERQAWFQLEALLSATGLAYAVLRPSGRASPRVEGWLRRVSRHHLQVDPGHRRFGWNNHYYRRSLHAAAIGVAVGDDELFRYGVSAVLNALGELAPDGAFPREVTRGARVVHYQNYALLYLVPIVELVARQGYPAWELAPAGRTIHDAVRLALDLQADPGLARRYSEEPQHLGFMQDPQYVAWMEIYAARFRDPRIEATLAARRPVWNRNAVGAATLYFHRP